MPKLQHTFCALVQIGVKYVIDRGNVEFQLTLCSNIYTIQYKNICSMTSGHSMCRVSRVSPGGGLVFFSHLVGVGAKKNEWHLVEDWKIELGMRMGWVVAGCLRKLTFYYNRFGQQVELLSLDKSFWVLIDCYSWWKKLLPTSQRMYQNYQNRFVCWNHLHPGKLT